MFARIGSIGERFSAYARLDFGGTMSKPITILLADDHTMFRQGLREILERKGGFQVVAEVRDGAAAVEAAKTTSPDIA